MKQNEKVLKEIIEKETGIEQKDIQDEADLVLELGVSSLEMFEIACKIEDEFNIDIDKSKGEKRTFSDILDVIDDNN